MVCDALQHWTVEEWEARAHSAARRAPWRPGQRLNPAAGWCSCSGEPVGLATFVVRVEPDGLATLAAACPKCRMVPGGLWFDDPAVQGAGDPGRWLDFEALRRHPAAAELAGWSLASVDDGTLRRIHDDKPAVAAPAPVAPILPTESVAVEADEIVDPCPGCPECVPVAPTPPEPAPVVPAPSLAAVAPILTGPPVCLVASCDSKDGYTSKCGRTARRSKGKVECLPDAGMTGWGSKVTCPACLRSGALSAAA